MTTSLVWLAVHSMPCENCPHVIQRGEECFLMSPSDIRIVCLGCFNAEHLKEEGV